MNNFIYKLALLGILLFGVRGFSQKHEFGKISKEELTEHSYELDTTANAVVLYEKKRVYFEYDQANGFRLITDVFKRVKLYNKNGFDAASHEVFLYKSGGSKEKVSGLKGISYSLQEGKIVEVKLKKDGIFENEYSERYDQVKFTMPALKEGSVIDYKYKIVSPFIFNIGRISLQREIPIKKLKVAVEMPEYFNFKKFTTGYLPINFKESVKDSRITFTSTSRVRTSQYTSRAGATRKQDVDYKVMVNTITSAHVPAFKKEPYSGNAENYKSSIFYELQFTKFPDGAVKSYSTTWEDVAKTIYRSDNFGNELAKSNYYKDDLDNLLKNVNTPSEKIQSIYGYVKKKMTWNKQRSVFTRGGVRKAYKENTGNSAEINLMLTSMLSYAGLDANPVVVSTSDRVIALFPTLDGYNYVIARVKLPNGKILYLDATDKYGLPNILSDRVIRGSGRVIAKNHTSQNVDLRPKKPSMNRYSVQCEIDKEGMVNGKFNVRHMGNLAHDFREIHGAKDEESKIKRFKKKYSLDEIEEYTIKGVNEYGKGVSESFNFISYDQIELIENEMFFSPLLFLRDKENVFKSDERKYPVDFGYGYTNSYMVSVKIPEGYEVSEYPQSGAFKLPENIGSFSFRSNVANGAIQVVISETIATPFLLPDYYPVLKQFYNQLIEKENEQVVLKKI
ncbi:transglutaminase domain-containing protein [Aquimarina sediminis]|uniref:transglutaminase domain-containing protein n=1 Tax=Aquimarina sediminis TaxID=2070536 RepID=UPI000CA01389|nr:transglutaminase domain-containing protein [Aquimarina sediminis]